MKPETTKSILLIFAALILLIGFIIEAVSYLNTAGQEKAFLSARRNYTINQSVVWSNDYGMQMVCINSTKAVQFECYVFSCPKFENYITQFPNYAIFGCDADINSTAFILHRRIRPIQN